MSSLCPLLTLALFITGYALVGARTEENCELTPRVISVSNPTHQFLDACGRTRWFHGTNVVKKSHPWHPDVGNNPDICNENSVYPLCDSDMDFLQEMGVNVVRLRVMWAGAEPVRGEYNETYFEVIGGIIQRLADRGIYTLIDVHQDVMGELICGEGFPNWFIKKDWVPPGQVYPVPLKLRPFTTNETGFPDPYSQCEEIANWFLGYFAMATGDAFGRFYRNDDGILDSFSDYWQKIAEEYKDYNSVLGYDLLNEPWAGDIYENPLLLIPGVADGRNLEHVWQNCSQKIRQVDTETLIFFEGVTWDIRDGHENVPGYDGTKTAMSYHYYAPPQFTLEATYQNRIKDMDRLQTGGMLTEFRMWSGDNQVMGEMRDAVELADRFLQSWMGWEYNHVRWGDEEIEKHYARTYAPAVAGFVKEMGFNEDTAEFFITWTIDTTIKAPTEIKINKRLYYPHGFMLNITPKNAGTWERKDNQNIEVRYTTSAQNGEMITVKIVPAERDVGGGVGRLDGNPAKSIERALFLAIPLLFPLFSIL